MPDKAHILVVEDEAHLAFGIRFNLEAEGYRVTVAEDGPAALLALGDPSSPVDLVILDVTSEPAALSGLTRGVMAHAYCPVGLWK